MKTFQVHYPGDPPYEVTELTGKEFKDKVRGGLPGHITVAGIDDKGEEVDPKTIYFDEIICDTCNGEIREEDVCYLDYHALNCVECHTKYTKPHIKEDPA